MRKILTMLAAAALWTTPAHAQAMLDKDAFTAELAARIRSASGAEVRIVGPLHLTAPRADGTTLDLSVAGPFEVCRTDDAQACEKVKVRAVSQVIAALGSKAEVGLDAAVLPQSLRLMVPTSADCAHFARYYRAGATSLRHDVAPGICVQMVAENPASKMIVDTRILDELKIGEAQAWDLALRQTLAGLPKVADIRLGHRVPTLFHEIDVAAIILDIDGWRAVAAATDSPILMMVPDRNLVAVMKEKDVLPATFAMVARDRFQQAGEQGVSPYVYRWNGNGWTMIE